jgi:ribonuclease VapC
MTKRRACRVIVDSSALVAILRNEPEAEVFAQALDTAPRCLLSAANFLETSIVIERGRSSPSGRRLDELVEELEIGIEPVTEEQARIARQAYRDYGRGSGHPARLNFGDCFAYALARATGEPLLFKGDDFRHTDIAAALP